MSVRNSILAAITQPATFRRPVKIEIGKAAWTALKADPAALNDVCLVDDKLFFKGVEIDPFADIEPDSWHVIRSDWA